MHSFGLFSAGNQRSIFVIVIALFVKHSVYLPVKFCFFPSFWGDINCKSHCLYIYIYISCFELPIFWLNENEKLLEFSMPILSSKGSHYGLLEG